MDLCKTCEYKELNGDVPPCDICDGYDQYKGKKTTNADRIRAMSDEELAELLYETETQYIPINLSVENDWLDWLKQEVE